MDFAQRFRKIFGRCVFEQITGHAGIQRAAQKTGASEGGHDHHLRRHLVALDALRQLQSGEARHFDIGDQQIGFEPLQFAPRGFAIGGGGEHFDIGFQRQQRRERAAHHCLIFSQQDADHGPLARRAARGNPVSNPE